LFAPTPGIMVRNVSIEQLTEVANSVRSNKDVRMGNHSFRLLTPGGEIPRGDLFSWDLAAGKALGRRVPGPLAEIVARPSADIRTKADAYARRHNLSDRLGIRVRVEENPKHGRRPRRIRRELDQLLKSIIRIPWYTRVFVATDSEYIQQMLASHFTDTTFLPKQFDLQEPTGRYVHRQDKDALFTFVQEVDCLCRCRKIINISGFLNDHSVRQKCIREPFREAAYMHVVRR
jgi:hypothetical protein